MLTLPIKKKWFDMIASGEKKEEYRELSDYYWRRFRWYLGRIKIGESWHRIEFFVNFRNGYQKHSPAIIATCTVRIGEGRPEWGAEPGKEYYVLEIHEVRREH